MPKILQKSIIAESRLFHIEQLHLLFDNGNERVFERLQGKGHGAVLIIPVLGDEVLLVREYAAGLDRYEIGFPKGLLEAGEDALTAANREMQEEVGYKAENLTLLKETTVAPGYFGSISSIVLAQNLSPSKLPGDEPEPLEVVPWKLKDYRSLLEHDEFTEARSIAALLLTKERLL